MIIDNKGRIMGKINVVDLTLLIIIVLGAFILIKFTFFRPEYFLYKDMVVDVKFSDVAMQDIIKISRSGAEYRAYIDNDSYLMLSKSSVVCIDKIGTIKIEYLLSELKNAVANVGYDSKYYECIINSKFLLKTRVFDTGMFYKDMGYLITKGGYFSVSIGDITLTKGNIESFYDAEVDEI